jgi:transcriptional antiterminator NusG
LSKKWFVIHTYSGFERKVKLSIEDQFDHSSFRENFAEVVIPTEEVVEVRKGKKKVSSRKFFPGYILINVEMNQDIWYMIKNTAKVTGFLGGGASLFLCQRRRSRQSWTRLRGNPCGLSRSSLLRKAKALGW